LQKGSSHPPTNAADPTVVVGEGGGLSHGGSGLWRLQVKPGGSADLLVRYAKKSEPRNMEATIQDRIKEAIYGQAVGDTLGLGTEFLNK